LPPDGTNVGAEALVLALWSPKWSSAGLPSDRLVNTDGDTTKKPLASFPKTDLFEIGDRWGNPIAYFHRRDYARKDKYITREAKSDLEQETVVTARKDPVTGLYYNPDRYQLISAGLDGVFGTEDDIGNWTPRESQ
jgi:hypothetical protein